MTEGRTQFLLFFFLPSAAKDGGITKIYYVDYECKSVRGFIPSIRYSYIGRNAELEAGGVLHPILNRERVQGVSIHFPLVPFRTPTENHLSQILSSLSCAISLPACGTG